MATITLSRQQMLDVIAGGGSVSLPTVGIIYRADQVPSQAQLDAGLYDAPVGLEGQQSADIAARIARPGTRRRIEFVANGLGTGFHVLGDAFAQDGTASNVLPAGTNLSGGMQTKLATTAVLNATADIYNNFSIPFSNKPLFQCYLSPGQIAVERIIIGLGNFIWPTMLTADALGTAGAHFVGFRFSTAAADANWMCQVANAVTQTTVSSGVPVTAGQGRKFELSDDGANTTFKIDGNTVAVISATRPPAATIFCMGAGVKTLEAVAKDISVGWLYADHA